MSNFSLTKIYWCQFHIKITKLVTNEKLEWRDAEVRVKLLNKI